jgi:proteasome lid subunit RPN8/RPN11
MKWRISRSLIERIRAHAVASPDAEVCGLLAARQQEISIWIPVPNVAWDPSRSFALDPAVHVAASRAARCHGLSIVGHYHSHPSGDPLPSAADAAEAGEQGKVWLIVASRGWRLWISHRGGCVQSAFEPATFALTDAAPCKVEAQGPIGEPLHKLHRRGDKAHEIPRIRKPAMLSSVS